MYCVLVCFLLYFKNILVLVSKQQETKIFEAEELQNVSATFCIIFFSVRILFIIALVRKQMITLLLPVSFQQFIANLMKLFICFSNLYSNIFCSNLVPQ